MGQAERLEQWAVNRKHRPVGERQREAHLTFECQRVDIFLDQGHKKSVPRLIRTLINRMQTTRSTVIASTAMTGLTADDVRNVSFSKPPLGKSGYDEKSVNDFVQLAARRWTAGANCPPTMFVGCGFSSGGDGHRDPRRSRIEEVRGRCRHGASRRVVARSDSFGWGPGHARHRRIRQTAPGRGVFHARRPGVRRRRPLEIGGERTARLGGLREDATNGANGVAVALGERAQLSQRKRASPAALRESRSRPTVPRPSVVRMLPARTAIDAGRPGRWPWLRCPPSSSIARGPGCTPLPASHTTPLRSSLRSSASSAASAPQCARIYSRNRSDATVSATQRSSVRRVRIARVGPASCVVCTNIAPSYDRAATGLDRNQDEV